MNDSAHKKMRISRRLAAFLVVLGLIPGIATADDAIVVERDAAKTLVPNLNVCGWYDHCNGSIDLHLAIASKGGNFNAKRHSRLIVGPWSHSGLGKRRQGEIDFGPNAALDFNQLYAEWFGHWLRGDKNDIPRWAPSRVFVMGVNAWRNL